MKSTKTSKNQRTARPRRMSQRMLTALLNQCKEGFFVVFTRPIRNSIAPIGMLGMANACRAANNPAAGLLTVARMKVLAARKMIPTIMKMMGSVSLPCQGSRAWACSFICLSPSDLSYFLACTKSVAPFCLRAVTKQEVNIAVASQDGGLIKGHPGNHTRTPWRLRNDEPVISSEVWWLRGPPS